MDHRLLRCCHDLDSMVPLPALQLGSIHDGIGLLISVGIWIRIRLHLVTRRMHPGRRARVLVVLAPVHGVVPRGVLLARPVRLATSGSGRIPEVILVFLRMIEIRLLLQ